MFRVLPTLASEVYRSLPRLAFHPLGRAPSHQSLEEREVVSRLGLEPRTLTLKEC